MDLIPGSGRSLGRGNGNPLLHSGLKNSVDRGAWRATVHRVAKSWTRLNDWARTLCVSVCVYMYACTCVRVNMQSLPWHTFAGLVPSTVEYPEDTPVRSRTVVWTRSTSALLGNAREPTPGAGFAFDYRSGHGYPASLQSCGLAELVLWEVLVIVSYLYLRVIKMST